MMGGSPGTGSRKIKKKNEYAWELVLWWRLVEPHRPAFVAWATHVENLEKWGAQQCHTLCLDFYQMLKYQE